MAGGVGWPETDESECGESRERKQYQQQYRGAAPRSNGPGCTDRERAMGVGNGFAYSSRVWLTRYAAVSAQEWMFNAAGRSTAAGKR